MKPVSVSVSIMTKKIVEESLEEKTDKQKSLETKMKAEKSLKTKKIEMKKTPVLNRILAENLCEEKKVKVPPLSEESAQKEELNLTPELFLIFKRRERGFLKGCDSTAALPIASSNDIAQECTAGTRLGEQQPMAGQDTFGQREQTVLGENEGLGLASRERSQGCLTNERGNNRKLGVVIKRGKTELEQSKISKNC